MEVMECLCVFHDGKWHKVKLVSTKEFGSAIAVPFETECEQTVPTDAMNFKHRVPDCPSCWTLEEQNP